MNLLMTCIARHWRKSTRIFLSTQQKYVSKSSTQNYMTYWTESCWHNQNLVPFFQRVWHFSSQQCTLVHLLNNLPLSVGISRITSDTFDIAYHHSAICITYIPHSSVSRDIPPKLIQNFAASAIIYTPHGVPAFALKYLESQGIAQVTASMHGLHEVWNPKVCLFYTV
jgi:hypothetical protein